MKILKLIYNIIYITYVSHVVLYLKGCCFRDCNHLIKLGKFNLLIFYITRMSFTIYICIFYSSDLKRVLRDGFAVDEQWSCVRILIYLKHDWFYTFKFLQTVVFCEGLSEEHLLVKCYSKNWKLKCYKLLHS